MTIFCIVYILILLYSTLKDLLQSVFSGLVVNNNPVKSLRVSSNSAFVLIELDANIETTDKWQIYKYAKFN